LWLKPTAMIISITNAITAQIESARQGNLFLYPTLPNPEMMYLSVVSYPNLCP